jgi:biopolymer transport protein ExbD
VSRRRRGSREEPTPEVPLAPLIDMVFTILIFLLVSASFSKSTGLPLDLPSSAAAAPTEGEVTVSIGASLDLEADGAPISLGALPSAVRSGLSRAGGSTVVVAADRGVPAGLLVDVYDAALRGGAARVVLATEARR